MRQKRLVWQLFFSYLLILLITLVSVSWYFSGTFRQSHLTRTMADLKARAQLIKIQVAKELSASDAGALSALCRQWQQSSGTRVTVFLPSGKVLSDSLGTPTRMENHADRPEVAAALGGRIGKATRFSRILQRDMMYVAVPMVRQDRLLGVVRTGIMTTAVDRTLRQTYFKLALSGLAAMFLVALLSLGISRRISRPLEEIKHGAERFARGDLSSHLTVSGSSEVLGLAEAMNRMARELDDRIRTVLHQRNEQEAVLSSMVEGVLAVDTEERIIRLNRAAADLLGIDAEKAFRRRIQEVVRKADLLRFVAKAQANRAPVEGDIVLRDEGERFLQAHGTVLKDSRGMNIGALVVLNDVTRLRRLESIRRDFVANVSHELKTPVTAIKGFVETLMDGAMEKPEDARRFLEIITRQADRLNAIIDDLLALSRIEQEADRHQIPLQEGPLAEVAKAAIQACEINAKAKAIEIAWSCSDRLRARINAPLLEQALVNLIDNAVKYSPGKSRVQLEALREEGETLIRVRDQGCGIEAEHLPRLFERFYRVDKARSRKQGGTGLGLAIVKHIVQAHGGRIEVESTPGVGTIFTIHLPAL